MPSLNNTILLRGMVTILSMNDAKRGLYSANKTKFNTTISLDIFDFSIKMMFNHVHKRDKKNIVSITFGIKKVNPLVSTKIITC